MLLLITEMRHIKAINLLLTKEKKKQSWKLKRPQIPLRPHHFWTYTTNLTTVVKSVLKFMINREAGTGPGLFRYQDLVEIYSVSAEKIINDGFSYSENV